MISSPPEIGSPFLCERRLVFVTIPVDPPKKWFAPPAEGIPTDKRITILADGRVFGYIALWNTCHVGHPGCVKPPKGSPSGYEHAHHGETMTAEGELIPTAVIAGGTGHAPLDMKTALVPEYYENTGTQLMRVRYGEDENGLWFAGALMPDVNDLQVASIRASSISGDWRWHAVYRRGTQGMDFSGACLVNIPGFPMPSVGDVSSQAGTPYALAASATAVHIIEEEGSSVAGCDGNPEDCGCDGDCDQASLVESVVAAVTEKFGLTAAAAETETETEEEVDETPDPVAVLTEQVGALKEVVDDLVSDKLLNEIENTEV